MENKKSIIRQRRLAIRNNDHLWQVEGKMDWIPLSLRVARAIPIATDALKISREKSLLEMGAPFRGYISERP